ncbi:kinase-like domain-containing protein, partial [Tuber borchii]
LTSLWSNYGYIHRVTLTTPSNPTPTPCILKHIRPPSASSCHATESHLRKLISYRVERYFYTNLSRLLPSDTTKVASRYDVAGEHIDDALLLEDLTRGFPLRAPHTLPLSKTQSVIRWLAGFHATFWNHTDIPLIPSPNEVREPDTAEGVWAQGGYWYLATRSEEYASLEDSQEEEYAWLTPYALPVAEKLKTETLGRTLLHGDVKGANILFSKTVPRDDAQQEVKCALYDFQYIGSGLGVVDLAYFLGTTVDERDLRGSEKEEGLLRLYFEEVESVLKERGMVMGGYTWEALVQQWEWALVDWMRFMAGWGCWGNSGWVERRAKEICARWGREG